MLLWLSLACGPKPVTAAHGDAPPLSVLRAEGVGLAAVQVVQDLPAPTLPTPPPPGVVEQGITDTTGTQATVLDPVADGPFLRNEYIGNIRFGGGFIRTGDVALDARAKLMEFNSQDPYRVQATAWLQTTVTALLDERHIPYTPTTATASASRVAVRGMNEDDGRDNINVPRTQLVPGTLTPAPAPTPTYVVVPYLRSYYSHNGGWFIGQEYGCMAGARVEVTLALFDTRRGEAVWWGEATGRHLDLRVGQPSTAELDQFLLWAEDIVEAGLSRGFLRDGSAR